MKIDAIASPRGSNDNSPSPRSGWIFRKMWPRDVEAFTAHLLRLAPEQRSSRFGRAVSDEWVTRYATSTDWFRSVILGCWIAGKLRGIGEKKLTDRLWPRAAEAALSVERAFEGHGIGTELLHRVLLIARNRGVARVSMMYSPENLRVQRIIRKVHPNVAFSGDQIESEIALAPPDALSIAAELCDDGCALALSLWDWQGRLAPAA